MDRQQFYRNLEQYYFGIPIGNRKRSYDAWLDHFNPELTGFFWAMLFTFPSSPGRFPDLTGMIVAHAMMLSPGFSSPEGYGDER